MAKSKKKEKRRSEFGKGMVYPLVLFAMHMDRAIQKMSEYNKIEENAKSKCGMETGLFSKGRALTLWMNGASDHLYEMGTCEGITNSLGERIIKLRKRCLEWGHGRVMLQDMSVSEYTSIREEVLKIAFLLDKWLGAKPMRGKYE